MSLASTQRKGEASRTSMAAKECLRVQPLTPGPAAGRRSILNAPTALRVALCCITRGCGGAEKLLSDCSHPRDRQTLKS